MLSLKLKENLLLEFLNGANIYVSATIAELFELLKSKILFDCGERVKVFETISKVLPIKFVPTVIGIDIGTTTLFVDVPESPATLLAFKLNV